MGEDNACLYFEVFIQKCDADQLSVVSALIVELEESYGRIGSRYNPSCQVIIEEQLTKLENPLLERIRRVTDNEFLFGLKSPISIYRFWKYKNQDSLDLYMKDALNDDENLCRYISFWTSFWPNIDGGAYGIIKENKSNIETFISIEEAENRISGMKNTEVFSQLDYSTKAAVLTFHLWFSSGQKNDYDISREEIDSIISDWEE